MAVSASARMRKTVRQTSSDFRVLSRRPAKPTRSRPWRCHGSCPCPTWRSGRHGGAARPSSRWSSIGWRDRSGGPGPAPAGGSPGLGGAPAKRKASVQAVADRPADHAPAEQIDHHGQVQPPLACSDVGDVHAPLLVRAGGGEVLVDQVGRDREGVLAVRGALEPPLLASPQAVVPHQPSRSAAPDLQTLVAQLVHHPRAAVSPVRQREGGAHVGQHHHVLALAAARRPAPPGEVAALADAGRLLRRIDEAEPASCRLPG